MGSFFDGAWGGIGHLPLLSSLANCDLVELRYGDPCHY